MLDVKPEVVTKLKEVLPNTQFELSVESPTLPLITYIAIDDSVHAYGNTLGYSNIKLQIKVWTTSVSDLAAKMTSIDNKMRQLGLKRTYYHEMTNEDIIIGVSQYSGLVYEEFN